MRQKGWCGKIIVVGGLAIIFAMAWCCLVSLIFAPPKLPTVVDITNTKPPDLAPTKAITYDPIEARSACQVFVSMMLKSPSTAEFIYSTEKAYNITGKPKSYFLVIGAVDAQNSFGVVIRIWYECQVHYDIGLKDWVLDSLEFGE